MGLKDNTLLYCISRMTTPKATKKSGYAYATEKLAKKEEELEKTQVVMGGTMNLLAKNTQQRNNAQADASYLNSQLTSAKKDKNVLYFELMGRIVKYEPTAFDEVLPYALENGCFWECDSKDLGEYSVIGDYTTKTTKKTYKAHFTIYNRFLTKCETENDAPISYKGYFLMKNYPDKFEVDRTKTEYKTIQDFIKIKSAPEPIPEPIAIPQPITIPVCEPPKLIDGEWIKDEEVQHPNGKSKVKEYQNVYYLDLGDDNDEMVVKYFHPRLYEKRIITDWNAEMCKKTEQFGNPITREQIWVVMDYDTTPKRKIEKNKIWGIHPDAVNYLHAFGFLRQEEYRKERTRLHQLNQKK